MADVTVSEDALRALLKQALVDAIDERRDLFRDLVAEALEDAGLAEAIRAGQETAPATRADVLDALGDGAA